MCSGSSCGVHIPANICGCSGCSTCYHVSRHSATFSGGWPGSLAPLHISHLSALQTAPILLFPTESSMVSTQQCSQNHSQLPLLWVITFYSSGCFQCCASLNIAFNKLFVFVIHCGNCGYSAHLACLYTVWQYPQVYRTSSGARYMKTG